MHYTQRIFFSDDIFDDVPEPEDDIDTLFRKLEQVEPPPSVIQSILSSVSQLPPLVPPEASFPVLPVNQEPAKLPEIPAIRNKPEEASTETTDGEQQKEDFWGLLDGLVVRKEQCEPS